MAVGAGAAEALVTVEGVDEETMGDEMDGGVDGGVAMGVAIRAAARAGEAIKGEVMQAGAEDHRECIVSLVKTRALAAVLPLPARSEGVELP
jgi:hypothetical protein